MPFRLYPRRRLARRLNNDRRTMRRITGLLLLGVLLVIAIGVSAAAFQLRNPFTIPQVQFAFVDLNGKVTLLRHGPQSIFGPRISPNSKQVTYRDNNVIWIA